MTLAREVAVYQTGAIVYAIVAVLVTVGIYVWFQSLLRESDYLSALTAGAVQRARMRLFLLAMSATIGAGWVVGIFAIVLMRSFMPKDANEEIPAENRALIDASTDDDAMLGAITFVNTTVASEGAVRTRRILEKILENWPAFERRA